MRVVSAETPFEVARRMHGEGASAEQVVAALRADGLSEEDAMIAARAARGEAGYATSAVKDVPLPPRLPTEPPGEAPRHACPKHARWPVVGTCSRCGGFFCAKCALDAGLSDLPASKLCPDCDKRAPDGPVGIGGWLILPAIQLVVTPLTTLSSIISELQLITHPKIGALIVVELLVLVAYGVYSVATAIAFFGRRRVAIRMMIVLYAASIAITLGSQVLLSVLNDLLGTEGGEGGGVIRGLGGSMIWLAYFLTSKRVKATFTR